MENPNKLITVIDGLQVRLHALNKPLPSLGNLHMATLINRDVSVTDYGLSVIPTEVTEGMNSDAIIPRIQSSYFKRELLRWCVTTHNLHNVDEALAVDQLSRNLRDVLDDSFYAGRLYGKGQRMFAKLELNHMWWVDMRNHNPEDDSFPEMDSSDKKRGLWGTWQIGEWPNYRGRFQLSHKDYTLIGSQRIPFYHNGKVEMNYVTLLSCQLKEEFSKRWGGLIDPQVIEDLVFKFDDEVVENSNPVDKIFNEVFSPFFNGFFGQEVVENKPVVEPYSTLSSLELLQPGMDILIDNEWVEVRRVMPTDHESPVPEVYLQSVQVKHADGRIANFMTAEAGVDLNGEINCYNLNEIGYKPNIMMVLKSAEGKTFKSMHLLHIDDQLHVVGYVRPIAQGLQLNTYTKLGVQSTYVIKSEDNGHYNPAINYLKITDIQTLHFDKRNKDWVFSMGDPKELAIELDGVMPSEQKYLELLVKYRSV